MAVSNTMDHRGGHNYLRGPSSPSSKLSPSSSSTNRQPFKPNTILPFNLKHSSQNSLSRTHPSPPRISRPVRHPKMTSLSSSSSPSKKRSLDESFEIDPTAPTGIEHLEIPTKKACLSASRPEIDIYLRRQKVVKYAALIRKKKALAKGVSSSVSRMPTSAQRGMTNPGPLCYRISLLQALLHQPKFVNWLLDSHLPADCVSDYDGKECLPCWLRELILGYWKGTDARVEFPKVFRNMDGLFKFLGWSSDVRSGHADPDEQAAWIFGAMRTAMPSSIFSSFESVMQLVTTSAIRCKCGHESRTEGHSDRALPIAIIPKIPNGTLAQYLQRYMIEIIDGYKCEKCKDDSKKKRVQLIGHAPDILAVQLKRFRFDGQKDNSPVTINTTLDLDKFRDTANTDHLQYDLTAVIKHTGGSSFGHYICSSKGPDGDWYRFDDQSVSKSSIGEATSAKGGFTPYLMFYQRKET